ncbi:hypothetical protein DL96DRAFT_184251, partial [Flagelloscypha sp. PMI_526]
SSSSEAAQVTKPDCRLASAEDHAYYIRNTRRIFGRVVPILYKRIMLDASTLRPDPHPIQESDDTVSELGLDLTQPQTPVQEVDSPTQTFFPHRPSTPRSSQLAHVNGSLSFNTDSIYLQGTDPPTRHEAIWSDPDDPDGERSMELATPACACRLLNFDYLCLLTHQRAKGMGERMWRRDTSTTTLMEEMSEATIPLPASPPGEDTYS